MLISLPRSVYGLVGMTQLVTGQGMYGLSNYGIGLDIFQTSFDANCFILIIGPHFFYSFQNFFWIRVYYV